MKTIFRQFALAISGTLLSGTIIAGDSGDKPLDFRLVKPEKKTNLLAAENGVFDADSKILTMSFGFSGGKYHKIYKGNGHSSATSPMLSISYEQALKNKVGPGYVGIGGFFAYQNAYSRYDNLYYSGNLYYYKHNWNYYTLAARGTYHLDALNNPRAEVYAGAIVGARIHNYSYTTNNPDPESNAYRLSEQRVYPAAALFMGARWYFVPNIGLVAEAGAGNQLSFATGGLSIKF